MANLDKDIVITPNKDQTADPSIAFSGANAAIGAQTIYANVYPLSGGTLSFEGSAGQLFSITNTLTGTIFSVNDISGIPSIEVLDSGVIRLAQYNGNVGIGTSTAQSGYKLQVTGNAAITNRVGIGTSNIFGVSNSLVVYGTAMVYGNLDLANPAGGTSGIYFNDGTYQTTAAGTVQNSSGAAGTVQYSGGSGTFAGDANNFFYDSGNSRLGIGTGAPTNTLSAWGITPAWFRTSNGSNIFEVLVGNATTTAATLGYASTPASPYSYIKNAGGTNGIAVVNNGSVGIRGITNPQSALDVGGAVAIGSGYAGVTAGPTNGLIVQGLAGIGTTNPLSTLDVNGIITARTAFSTGGTATVNALVSNGAVSGTTGTFTSALYGASFNTAGTATVNALVSNVYGRFGQNVTINSTNASTSTTTGALIVGGGIGAAGNINAGGTRNAFTGFVAVGAATVPSYALDVTGEIAIRGGEGVDDARMYFQASDSSNRFTIETDLDGTTGNDLLGFRSVSTDNILVLKGNGAIGIGTTAPGSTLDVNGVISARTAFSTAGTANVNALTSNTGITVSAGGVIVTGLSTFTGNVGITGNLTVTGTINTQNANVLVVNDPIIYLGEGNTSNLWDLGIIANYNDGVYEHTGLVRNRNDGIWTLFDNMTSEPNVTTGNINWADSTLTFAPMKLGNLTVVGNTRSTSSTTGAIALGGLGGIGVGGNIYVGGQQSGISGNIWIAGSNASTSSTSGALVVTNGVGIGGALNVGTTISTGTAATATAASHYWVQTGSDNIIRPKTLANVQSEVVTTSAVNAALSAYSVKTANYTAVNNDRLLCDTSGGTFTITLPATPTLGTNITIYDKANFTAIPLTVARNGSTIENLADDFSLDIGQTRNEIVYDGSTWHIYVSIGPRGLPGSNAAPSSSVAYSIALG